ncbi:hypothetical protein CC2G_000550 [Coprinopsis cinerea AmutBmut pab1-1]|nr:hypothetical protein CC2G_000550 [Coprinopsis cinerea AmutBmut pab1-1]
MSLLSIWQTTMLSESFIASSARRSSKTLLQNIRSLSRPALCAFDLIDRSRHLSHVQQIYPSLAGELDVMLSAFPHTHLITCPVLGTPGVAEKSQLLLIMSGEYRSKKAVAHILVPSVGRKVVDLGGDLEKALTYKLMANSMILGSIEVIAEALTFAEKSGIGSDRVFDLVKDYFPAPSMINYTQRMMTENFDGSNGFAIDGGIKDATHIRRLSAKHNCPMPTIDVAHQHLVTARALHLRQKKEGKDTFEVLDWSGIIAGARTAAGLSGLDRSDDPTPLPEAMEPSSST